MRISMHFPFLQLRERLALLKIEEKKEEERKRKDIIQSKVVSLKQDG